MNDADAIQCMTSSFFREKEIMKGTISAMRKRLTHIIFKQEVTASSPSRIDPICVI